MSAVPPTPPPHRSPLVSRGPGRTTAINGDQPIAPRQPMKHLQDIISAAAAEAAVDPREPIGRLLEKANISLRKAHSYLDYKRLDFAFHEYLVAATIILDVIPRHKDAPGLRVDRGRLGALNDQCIKDLRTAQDKFDAVKNLIRTDNEQSGVKPVYPKPSHGSQALADVTGLRRTASPSVQDRPQSAVVTPLPNVSSQFPTIPLSERPSRNSIASHPAAGVGERPQVERRAPPVHSKPKYLHGNSIVSNGQQGGRASNETKSDDLSERFARLSNSQTTSPARTSPPNYTSSDSYASLNSHGAGRLPKLPSPTYSPGRSSPVASIVSPPPNPEDTRFSLPNPPSTINNGPSDPYTLGSNGYHAAQEPLTNSNGPSSNGTRSIPRRRRDSEQMPQETQVTAQRLYDYMKAFNVLLIDVRSREQYDFGHIFSQSVICVEPVALRRGMSAEELVDSLVISPDAEPELFERRDEYELVVYYDQSTETTDFLDEKPGSNVVLKYLHDALCDFNQEKPLHWSPMLLIGGLDAWVDLLGQNALQMSNTAPNRTAALKRSRPIARRPPVSNTAKINVLKRRREYNPLAPEEEEKWRERARKESIVLESQPDIATDEEPTGTEDESQEDPGYNDFYTRYPDVASVEQQIMAAYPPSRPPPEPPRVPNYPELPPPSAPSRPRPTVPRTSYSGVSERVPSQASTVSKSAELAPYIPPKLYRLPRTGLHNFGATCYMNSTIQCLSATIPLTAFFFEGRFKRYIQRDNWKGSKGLMPELYNTLLQHLWRTKDVSSIRPTDFRTFCARLNREWGIDRQQDAKEFLEFLVDALHEDLNVNWAKSPLKALTTKQEATRERLPAFYASKMEWERYVHRDSSELTDLFAGQHISRLQCTTCGHSSTTYEAFYSISVEIPQASSKGQQIDIYDCLRSYCSAEKLTKEDCWRCPNCKTYREATKRITITRVPKFLVIHFKRFSAGHAERARKVHTPVDFPLTGLDLKAYVLPQPSPSDLDQLASAYGPGSTDSPGCMTPPYRYDAYAVMRHIGGTMTSGHYISHVEDKARGCWREFNDERVNDYQPDQLAPSRRLQNEQAYIVFYQRV